MQSTIANVNNIQLHYLSQGHGKLILFLHGFPEFSLAWKKQLEFFATDYFVVAPDLRGFNLSDKPDALDQYHMHHLVEDVHELLTHLGYQQCILVGHDFGGSIALCFAAKYPQHVEKLIIINAAHPAIFHEVLQHSVSQQKASAYVNLLRDARAEKMLADHHYDYFWHHLLLEITEKKLFSPEMIQSYEAAWNRKDTLKGALNYYRAWPLGIDFNKQSELMTSVPTLIIWGEKDRSLTPEILIGFQKYLINFSVVKILEGSHWVVHEESVRINHLIRAFVPVASK